MKKTRALAKGLGTEMAEKLKIKMKRDLEKRLGLYPRKAEMEEDE